MKNLITTLIQRIKSALSLNSAEEYAIIHGDISELLGNKAAKPWKEEDHPRGARGRWTPTGEADGRAWTASGGLGAGAWFDKKKGKWVIQVGKEVKPLSKEWHDRYEEIRTLSTDKLHTGMVDVRLNPDFSMPCVAIGRPWIAKDQRPGQPKWVYTDEHKVKKYKAKWAAMKKFDKVKAEMKEKSYQDGVEGKAAAQVAFLMDQTAIRVGSGKSKVKEGSTFGACDLQAKHVQIRGNRVNIKFMGKGKKLWDKSYVSERLATILKVALTASDGTDKKGNARLFDVTRDTVAAYMRSVAGKGANAYAKPHMFRYWSATSLASKYLAKKPRPKTKEEASALKKEACQHVADYLNDTPDMVYSTYIAPNVWKDWGEDIRPASPALHQKHFGTKGLRAEPTSDDLQRYMDEYLDSFIFPDFENEDEWSVDELYPDADEEGFEPDGSDEPAWEAVVEGSKKFDTQQTRDAGGRWVASTGSAEGVGSYFAEATRANQKAWIKAHSTRYNEDEEFQVVADAITMFTQGEYGPIREMAKYEMTGTWSSRYADSSVPDWYDGHKRMWGWVKPYFPGQRGSGDSDVVRSKHSYRDAAAGLTKAIASAPPVSGTLYRGLGTSITHEQVKYFSAMSPGDVIAMPAPSSFTTSPTIAENIAKGTDPGFQGRQDQPTSQVLIEVEPGARGIHAGALSPWKQEEVISSGKFEVTGKTVEETQIGRYKTRTIIRVKVKQVAVWELNKGTKAAPAIPYEALDQPEFITNMFDGPWFPSEHLSVLVSAKTFREEDRLRDDHGRWTGLGFHATLKENLDSILEHGITRNLRGKVFISPWPDNTLGLSNRYKDRVVFKVVIPDRFKDKFKEYVSASPYASGALAGSVKIRPEWIKGWMVVRKGVIPTKWKWETVTKKFSNDLTLYACVELMSEEGSRKSNPYKDDKGRFTFKPNASPRKTDEAHQGLMQFLRLVGGMMASGYQGKESIFNVDLALADHGEARSDVKAGKPRMKPKMCFNNSITRAIQDGSTYTEGKVFVHGIPIAHAWNTLEDGTAMDHTIVDPEKWTYVGLKIPPQTLATIVTSKHFGRGIYDGALGTVNAFLETERKRLMDEIIAFNSQAKNTPVSTPGYSNAELTAVETYRDNQGINGKLRSGKALSETDGSLVSALDSAISKDSLDNDTILYRVVDDTTAMAMYRLGHRGSFVDSGYLSTTKTKSAAKRLAKFLHGQGGKTIVLSVQKGTHLLDMGKVSDGLGEFDWQQEVLLERGLSLSFVKEEKSSLFFQVTKPTDTKRAGLLPAGSHPGDEEIILALIKMGLTRAEARRYLTLSRQKRD